MGIQWGRVLLAGFLMELVLIAIAIPLTLGGADRMLVYVIPPASFIATFAVTVWLGRRFTSRPILQGALVGLAGPCFEDCRWSRWRNNAGWASHLDTIRPERSLIHRSFAYSALACCRIGISTSASFHAANKSSYARRAGTASPASTSARARPR
jgi:hypothetical protein